MHVKHMGLSMWGEALHALWARMYILNDNIPRALQFGGGKLANFQIMGPSSLNIHFWVLGVLCFLSLGNSWYH